MNTIVMIGKMNELMKNISVFLRQYFSIQLCSENSKNAIGMVKVVEPELILISLVGFYENDKELFEKLESNYPDTPVITIGTESESNIFRKFYESDQFENLVRPLDNAAVLDAVCKRLGLNKEQLVKNAVIKEDKRKKVLVVDDNATTLRSIKGMLDEKYNVMLANSGMKAMTSIGKNRPDVILLDYEMPVCDGRQTLEMIRADEERSDIPVIFLTGVNDRAHIEAVLKLRPAGYMLKPAVPEKLIKAIENAMQ